MLLASAVNEWHSSHFRDKYHKIYRHRRILVPDLLTSPNEILPSFDEFSPSPNESLQSLHESHLQKLKAVLNFYRISTRMDKTSTTSTEEWGNKHGICPPLLAFFAFQNMHYFIKTDTVLFLEKYSAHPLKVCRSISKRGRQHSWSKPIPTTQSLTSLNQFSLIIINRIFNGSYRVLHGKGVIKDLITAGYPLFFQNDFPWLFPVSKPIF